MYFLYIIIQILPSGFSCQVYWPHYSWVIFFPYDELIIYQFRWRIVWIIIFSIYLILNYYLNRFNSHLVYYFILYLYTLKLFSQGCAHLVPGTGQLHEDRLLLLFSCKRRYGILSFIGIGTSHIVMVHWGVSSHTVPLWQIILGVVSTLPRDRWLFWGCTSNSYIENVPN